MPEIVNVSILFFAIIFGAAFIIWFSRRLILWYFCIDEARENERKIIALLQRIAAKD